MSAVWNAPPTAISRTCVAPSSFATSAARYVSAGAARDHAVAGGIGVGKPHVAVGSAAGDAGPFVVYPRYRQHDPDVVLGGLLHRLAPLGDEPHGVFEPDTASSDQRRVLAKAVPGAGRRLDAEPFDGVQDDEAHDEGGQLGVASLGELFDAGVEQQALDVPTGDAGLASCTTSQEGWSRQARPMPGLWDPCPGKTNAGNPAALLGPLTLTWLASRR